MSDLTRLESKIDNLDQRVTAFMLLVENRLTKVETKTLLMSGGIAAVFGALVSAIFGAVSK